MKRSAKHLSPAYEIYAKWAAREMKIPEEPQNYMYMQTDH